MLVTDSVKGRMTRSKKYGVSAVFDDQGILAGSGITLADSVPLLGAIGIPDAEIAEPTPSVTTPGDTAQIRGY